MSHDDGPIVDVELLADLGYVAQRLRGLEKTWTINLKELQQMSINGFGEPPKPTAISLSPSLNELFASTQVDNDSKGSEDLSRQIKLLEDTVIKIYHQQELSQKKFNKKVTIQNTMNYSSKNQSYCGGHCAHYAASDFCENEQSTAPIVNKLIEKTATNRNDDDKDKENKQQPNLYQFMSNNDVKMLIKELKRKVDYTERMNWLCLSNRPNEPPNRKSSLPKHSEVKKRFLEMCDVTLSDDVKAALRLPSFDSYDWEDWEILHLMETMFVELNLLDKFQIPQVTLREWLYEVYKHYNEVPFHNFRHCFCVAQMMYSITWHTNLLGRLGDLDVLILLISCICHDLDHPGYNNIYQINARTELALRYNDISPLENHHCSIAFRLLEHPDCNVLAHINKDMEVREGIIRCILATDMSRHNEILTQFQEVIPIFDYSNKSHKNLLCMVLIKVADISNEARPMDVAEPWLDRLLQEFFAQSAAEKLEGLPVTPFMDPDKVSKPGSQVRFIGLVLLPLFESLGETLPELVELIIIPVRVALDYYKRLNDAAQKNRKSLAETEGSSDGDELMPRSQSGISVRSRRSIPSQKSASRNSVDEPCLIAAELHDLPEGSESGDSETATEVDVAEKTSKFKVDTESRNKLNQEVKVQIRKCREKRPSMVGEIYTTGGNRVRGSYGNIHNNYRNVFGSNRAISLDQYSNHRRMSDGIQTVTSDSSVYYNQRQHRNLDQEVLSSTDKSGSINSNNASDPIVHTKKPEEKMEIKMDLDENDLEKAPPLEKSILCTKNNNNINSSFKLKKANSTNSTSSSSNNTKSIISRLRQLTGRLSFTFDKESRRLSNNSINQTFIKQASATVAPTDSAMDSSQKGDESPSIRKGVNCISKDDSKSSRHASEVGNSTRSRAYSLDVPSTKYNFNSGPSSNDGSHKSLASNKNEDSLMDETNSNGTLSNADNSVFNNNNNNQKGSEVDPIDGADI